MVDRYTKVILTIIAVGLWVQVGLQLNPVKSAAADLVYSDKMNLAAVARNTEIASQHLLAIRNHFENN
jgi:hypothetical protein